MPENSAEEQGQQPNVEYLHPDQPDNLNMPATYSQVGTLPALRLDFEERMGNSVSRLEAALDRVASNTEAIADEAEQAATESEKTLRAFEDRFRKRGV